MEIFEKTPALYTTRIFEKLKSSLIFKPDYMQADGKISHVFSTAIAWLKRYVDDILALVHFSVIDSILPTFNSYNANLQFTLELEDENNSINFLNITIFRSN